MPWTPKDSAKHTKKADTPKEKRQWSAVANSSLKRGDSDATAIRKANSVIARGGRKK